MKTANIRKNYFQRMIVERSNWQPRFVFMLLPRPFNAPMPP
jgi:hypothetical protein